MAGPADHLAPVLACESHLFGCAILLTVSTEVFWQFWIGQTRRACVVRNAPKISLAAMFLADAALLRRLVYHAAFPPRGIFASVTFRNCDVAVMSTGLAVSQAAWRDAEFAD
jgi:hypothetical protein